MTLIPLQSATLCQDCDRVSESTGSECIGCGSKAIVNLSRLLSGRFRLTESSDSMLNKLLADVETTIKRQRV